MYVTLRSRSPSYMYVSAVDLSQQSHMVSLDLGELSVSQSHNYPAEKRGSSEPPRTPPLRTALDTYGEHNYCFTIAKNDKTQVNKYRLHAAVSDPAAWPS